MPFQCENEVFFLLGGLPLGVPYAMHNLKSNAEHRRTTIEEMRDQDKKRVRQRERENPLTKTMDLAFIQTLVDTIGHEMVIASLGVFKEKIPEYMETLHLSLTAKDKDDVCSQAHKIKGAASSIGLSRIQKVANQIQQGDHPTWWKNVHEWVDELDAAIAHDVDGFDDWIKTQNFAE